MYAILPCCLELCYPYAPPGTDISRLNRSTLSIILQVQELDIEIHPSGIATSLIARLHTNAEGNTGLRILVSLKPPLKICPCWTFAHSHIRALLIFHQFLRDTKVVSEEARVEATVDTTKGSGVVRRIQHNWARDTSLLIHLKLKEFKKHE
jgi:hypothetical protein